VALAVLQEVATAAAWAAMPAAAAWAVVPAVSALTGGAVSAAAAQSVA